MNPNRHRTEGGMSELAQRLREPCPEHDRECSARWDIDGKAGCVCGADIRIEEWHDAREEAAAAIEELARDAERWRWAREDNMLWGGTYDCGVASPEDADAIADSAIDAAQAKEKK